jgi:hypothetical protein
MLAVLNPHSLAEVCLKLEHASTDSAAMSAALLRLSSLQRLRLVGLNTSLGSALTDLAQLSQVTSLELSADVLEPCDRDRWATPRKLAQVLQALPQLLAQPLPLQELKLGLWRQRCQLPALDMALLIKLTELDVSTCVLAEESVLPAQLQWLAAATWVDSQGLAPVTGLKQLKHLSLQVNFTQQQQLLQLALLPALQHLALQYRDAAAAAAATASAWQLLPQLLVIEHMETRAPLPSKQRWSAMMAGTAAATSLTKLELDPRMRSDGGPIAQPPLAALFEPDEVAPCVRLTRPRGLKSLRIGNVIGPGWGINLATGDVLALTAHRFNTVASVARSAWGERHCSYNAGSQANAAAGLVLVQV